MNPFISNELASSINKADPLHQNFQIGTRLKIALDHIIGIGTRYYLDPTNGNDNNDGLSPQTAFKTLQYAYNKIPANKHNILFYIAGPSSISLSSQFTWAKNYTHFIGIAAPTMAAQRARIFQEASATGISPLINFTATGCICKNIYVFHGVNDATSKICMTLSGGRNYFENVHLAGIGHATMSVAGSADLKLDGAEENLFVNCNIGVDTITRDADAVNIWLDGAATRNKFVNCMINAYISAAGYANVKVEDGTGIDRWLIFDNCLFVTDSVNRTITQTSVFNLPAGIVQGMVILKNCGAFSVGGAVDWDSNDRGAIWNNTPAAAASGAGGILTNQ